MPGQCQGFVLWLTGLSGSGKSTLAALLKERLRNRGLTACVIDGDEVRSGLSADLGYAPTDRREQMRRVCEVSRLVSSQGINVVVAMITPKRLDREWARRRCGKAFHEAYVKADLATCESRDVKGHYAAARRGDLLQFTGIDSPYEPPQHPDIELDTMNTSAEQCVDRLETLCVEISSDDKGSR
jgi:adenylyl-sulfate kinase